MSTRDRTDDLPPPNHLALTHQSLYSSKSLLRFRLGRLASLSKEGSAVERAGAAQGLAEVCTRLQNLVQNAIAHCPYRSAHVTCTAQVISALGDAKVAELLPSILDGCANGAPHVREGYAMLWIHMPAVLGKRFEPFLEEVLPAVLEYVACMAH